MGILIGLVVTLGCVLGGFMAMGGHLHVLMQPWELVIIGGAALGTFLVANPMKTVKDTGKGIVEAFKQAVPKERDYLETLGVLHSLMRELRSKSRRKLRVRPIACRWRWRVVTSQWASSSARRRRSKPSWGRATTKN